MRQTFVRLVQFIAIFCLSAPAWGQAPFSLQPAPKDISDQLPRALQDVLEQQGNRLLGLINGQNVIVADIWWRKNIPLEENPEGTDDTLYPRLQLGGLLGVLRFPAESTDDFREDFRDQKLRPGFYTMRYARMPKDQTHKNVSPHRDFVILTRANLDTGYARLLPLDELLKLSRVTITTRHPPILSLVSVNQTYKTFPEIVIDDSGLCVLQVKLHGQSSTAAKGIDLPLAIILVTPQKDEGGS